MFAKVLPVVQALELSGRNVRLKTISSRRIRTSHRIERSGNLASILYLLLDRASSLRLRTFAKEEGRQFSFRHQLRKEIQVSPLHHNTITYLCYNLNNITLHSSDQDTIILTIGDSCRTIVASAWMPISTRGYFPISPDPKQTRP
jgi:hypothetical protein